MPDKLTDEQRVDVVVDELSSAGIGPDWYRGAVKDRLMAVLATVRADERRKCIQSIHRCVNQVSAQMVEAVMNEEAFVFPAAEAHGEYG